MGVSLINGRAKMAQINYLIEINAIFGIKIAIVSEK